MVNFLTLLKDTFRQLQLRAEIALLDRDATNRQRAFGVELYDLIERQRGTMLAQIEETIERSNNPNNSGGGATTAAATTTPSHSGGSMSPADVEGVMRIFQTIENEIRVPLDACRKDVGDMEASVPRFPSLLIQRRKEEFGVAVWPIVSKNQWLHESLEEDLNNVLSKTKKNNNNNGNNDNNDNTRDISKDIGNLVTTALKGVVEGTKTTITKAIGKLSPEECEVEACVTLAKRDVAVYEDTKKEKLSEIEALVSGGSTLECC